MSLWGWIKTVLSGKIKDEFGVKPLDDGKTGAAISECLNIYAGNPEWLNDDDYIKTINFAQSICSEIARLVMLGTKVTVDGSARAKWLQEQVDKYYNKFREWVEYGCAGGNIILKPYGNGVDLEFPGQFKIIAEENGSVTAAVFESKRRSDDGQTWYRRLEYHYFDENGLYHIENRCFQSENADGAGDPVNIAETPWAELQEETTVEGVEKPLFALFKTPNANNIEPESPMGLPIFHPALKELRDLDIAYSRNSLEIQDSEKIVLLDSDRLIPDGTPVQNTTRGFERARDAMKLPHYVRNVYGDGRENFYQEINPELRTAERLVGINSLLSQIGFKCGFSNGYFVFNEKSGMVTATQVESDDRRTIQLIKDVRDKLESCLDGLMYALNVFADLYDLAPAGEYEVTYDFGDITYNREEDRQRWWGYVVAGRVPPWMYFNKFEGMSEEDAKKMVEEATPKETLFPEAE